jgi:hypothetical protein
MALEQGAKRGAQRFEMAALPLRSLAAELRRLFPMLIGLACLCLTASGARCSDGLIRPSRRSERQHYTNAAS